MKASLVKKISRFSKMLGILSCTTISTVYADTIPTTTGASNACASIQAQVQAGRDIIKQAYAKGDGCTIGKQEIKNHSMIQANLTCFPNFKKNEYNLFHVMDDIDTSIESTASECDKDHALVLINHQKIKKALISGDGCTAGKLQIQNHNTIQAHLSCFPNFKRGEYHLTDSVAKYDASAVKEND